MFASVRHCSHKFDGVGVSGRPRSAFWLSDRLSLRPFRPGMSGFWPADTSEPAEVSAFPFAAGDGRPVHRLTCNEEGVGSTPISRSDTTTLVQTQYRPPAQNGSWPAGTLDRDPFLFPAYLLGAY